MHLKKQENTKQALLFGQMDQNLPKKYASRDYQLKLGHGAIEIFLARIGVIETPECW